LLPQPSHCHLQVSHLLLHGCQLPNSTHLGIKLSTCCLLLRLLQQRLWLLLCWQHRLLELLKLLLPCWGRSCQ
jgi:hypothetical protein